MKLIILIFLFFNSFLFSKEITVKHIMGETKVKTDAKRIVTLFSGATDTALALGVKPIGIVQSWVEKPTYKYLRKYIKKTEYLGLETQVNIEKIALLKPDLIIATKHRHEKIYKMLSLLAPTIMTDDIADFKSTLILMGKALNKEEKVKKILNRWNLRVKKINTELRSIYKTWPQTISAINVRPDYIRAYLKKSYTGSILSELGFIVKNSKNYPQKSYINLTSKENIPSLDADIFVILKQSKKDMIQDYYNEVKRSSLWRLLKAVKNKKVYEVNSTIWSFSSGIIGANLVLDDVEKLFIENAENE